MLQEIIVRLFEIIWPSYSKYMQEQIEIIVPILVAILTGGFLMLFIENQHSSTSINNRYRFIMEPFYHKLSNYFKFVGTFRTYIRISDKKGEYVNEFSGLVNEMGHLAHDCIVTGQDYPIDYFKPKDLEKLCDDINNIWFYLDRKLNVLRQSLSYDEERANCFNKLGKEFLHEVSSKYDGKRWNMSLLMNVSGEFYTNVWQPLQHVPAYYEYWQEKAKEFSYLTIASLSGAIITLLLILLLRYLIPVWVFTLLTVLSMGLLSFTLYRMIKMHNLSSKLF